MKTKNNAVSLGKTSSVKTLPLYLNKRTNKHLTVSVPLGERGYIGEVGDNHHATRQTDGAALHTKGHWEPIEQGDLQLTGVDLSQMGHWERGETSFLIINNINKYSLKQSV